MTISQSGIYKMVHDLEILEIFADNVTIIGNCFEIKSQHDIKNLTLDGLTVKSPNDFQIEFNRAKGISIINCIFYGIKFSFDHTKYLSVIDVVYSS